MDKTSYIAITVSENGKFYSFVVKNRHNTSLLYALRIKGIVSANICDTMKKAREIVKEWNDTYKRNGTYMFADTF